MSCTNNLELLKFNGVNGLLARTRATSTPYPEGTSVLVGSGATETQPANSSRLTIALITSTSLDLKDCGRCCIVLPFYFFNFPNSGLLFWIINVLASIIPKRHSSPISLYVSLPILLGVKHILRIPIEIYQEKCHISFKQTRLRCRNPHSTPTATPSPSDWPKAKTSANEPGDTTPPAHTGARRLA